MDGSSLERYLKGGRRLAQAAAAKVLFEQWTAEGLKVALVMYVPAHTYTGDVIDQHTRQIRLLVGLYAESAAAGGYLKEFIEVESGEFDHVTPCPFKFEPDGAFKLREPRGRGEAYHTRCYMVRLDAPDGPVMIELAKIMMRHK